MFFKRNQQPTKADIREVIRDEIKWALLDEKINKIIRDNEKLLEKMTEREAKGNE